MGTPHSLLFLYCVFISNFISTLYCDDAYSYPRPPDRLSLSVGRPRQRAYNNRCSRVTIPNGSMVLKHRGRVAKFTCNSGYKLIGDNIATCHQRKWDAVPTCVKNVQCPKEMPKVMNGRMVEFSYVYFRVICNDGYKLPDNIQSIYPCEEFFRPDVNPPVCQLSDALYCDFEKDTCGWNNTIPYFSWIRYQNATPSHELHTGPGGDHTTGTGHYLYIEASGLPDHEERYAKLTRLFKKVDTPEVCFVFWYHMYGFNIGTLDVYVDFNKVFSKSGNLGEKWRKGIVQRLPSDRDFYISIMATTANGYAGDIAIDDIGLVNSTDCTKTILIETTCKNRCFENEINPKLCKCSSECLIEGTCCTDFMHFCSNDVYTSTTTAETTQWETAAEGWEMSSIGVLRIQESGLGGHSSTESTGDGRGSTEMYYGSTSDYDSSLSVDEDTKLTEGGLVTEPRNAENWITGEDYLTSSEPSGEPTLLIRLSGSSKWQSSTEQELGVSTMLPSTWRAPQDVGESWSSTQQESYHEGKSLPSTQQEVSEEQSSIYPERHGMSTTWPSTTSIERLRASSRLSFVRQPVTSSLAYSTARLTWIASSADAEIHTELSHQEPNVSGETRKNMITTDDRGWVTDTSEIESTTELIKTTPHTLARTTPSTSSTLFVTPQPTVALPSTTGQRKSEARTVAATTNSYLADVSSTASHTHLQENDYDEFDEPTQAATQGVHWQKQLDSETTPLADLGTTGKTRTPYKWKKTYEPKGRFTFSAVKSENKTTTYVSVLVAVSAFLGAAVVAAYIFRRRRAIRFRDATEESDVLYMTSDEILDFSVARRPTPSHPGQPNSGPTTSQLNTRVCQSDFSFGSSS